MTLEEAIKHCEEKAKGCDECSKEHQQLAEWLRELKLYRQLGGIDDIRTDKEHIMSKEE